MIDVLDFNDEQLIALALKGKISKEDVQEIHKCIHKVLDKEKKPNFYFDLEGFEGYELQGLWEDLKVDIAHINDYGNMALVGDEQWEKWAAKASDFFIGSDVRFFELSQREEAKQWILKK